MKFLTRLNRPWIHFLVLGAALFWAQGKLFPEPPVVIGPLSEVRIEALQQQWTSTVGRLPSEQQMQRMIVAELDRDMMFQKEIASIRLSGLSMRMVIKHVRERY